MPETVRVKGLRESVRTLERYGVEVQDLKEAFGRIGRLVVGRAQARVARRSGALARSIRPAKSKNKSVVRAGGKRVPYAGVRHYGGQIPKSGYVTADPYLAEPAEQIQPEAIRLIQQDLEHLAQSLGLKP